MTPASRSPARQDQAGSPAPNPDKVIAEARELIARGRVEPAEQILKELLQQRPGALAPRLELAELYTQCGCPIEAAFQWSQVLVADPGHKRAADQMRRLEPILTAVREVQRFNPPELQVTVRCEVIVLVLAGVMTPHGEQENLRDGFDRLTAAVESLMKLGLCGCVVDMARVNFVTSYFLSQLLGWLRRARRYGGRLAICNVHPEIHRMMKLTRLGPLIPTAPSLQAAIAAVRAARTKPGPTP